MKEEMAAAVTGAEAAVPEVCDSARGQLGR